MIFHQAFLFKLKPDGAQLKKLARFAGCSRWVYNQGLTWHDEQRKLDPTFHISYYKLSSQLQIWKKEYPWLKQACAQSLQQSLRDLDTSFINFFKGRTAFPKKHKKHSKTDSFRFPQGFKLEEGNRRIYLPKIGWMNYVRSRFIFGKPKNVIVSRQADGWYMSVQTEYEYEIPEHFGDVVGIDMGCVRYCTFSDGTYVDPLNALKKQLEKLNKMQRKLSRLTRFGKNWRKQVKVLAKLHQRVRRQRDDFIEKVSLDICKKHAVIIVEDLRIKNMTASARGTVEEPGKNVAQKSGLNRSILDQAWGKFFRKLEWKAKRLGCLIIKIPPQNTSRMCPHCGHTSSDNRKSQAVFKCTNCGFQNNADVVASINIKRCGQHRFACEEFEDTALINKEFLQTRENALRAFKAEGASQVNSIQSSGIDSFSSRNPVEEILIAGQPLSR